MATVKIGFVGCGAISGIYLENITKRFKEIEIIGVCDLIPEKAQKARAEEERQRKEQEAKKRKRKL